MAKKPVHRNTANSPNAIMPNQLTKAAAPPQAVQLRRAEQGKRRQQPDEVVLKTLRIKGEQHQNGKHPDNAQNPQSVENRRVRQTVQTASGSAGSANQSRFFR